MEAENTKVTIADNKNSVNRVSGSESGEGLWLYQGVKSRGILRTMEAIFK